MRVRILLLLLLSVIVVSCSQERKLNKKIEKAKQLMYEHPKPFADPCSRLFPPVTGIDSITELKKGAIHPVAQETDVDLSDLMQPFIEGATYQERMRILDSISRHPFKVKVKCPDCDVQDPDTLIRQVTITVENKALISMLNDTLAQRNSSIVSLNAKISKDKHTMGTMRMWLIILVVYTLVRFILGLIWPVTKRFLP